jgi:tRNA threonylcarbamoyladenosine biosynthesis protein TsaB
MILVIDTSTRMAGIALFDGVKVHAETIWTSNETHTVELAPVIQTAFQRTRITPKDINLIGVALGPGSFTSLRIGLAMAKGLAFSQRVPIVGVPTLDILAAGQPFIELPMAAVLRAGRGRLAVGWYRLVNRQWKSNGKLQVLEVQELSQKITKPTYVCGELTAEERRFLGRKRKNVQLASPALSLRRPSFLAELTWQRWQAGLVDDPVSLSPYYLHIGDPIPE